MANRLFLPQTTLDEWLDANKVELIPSGCILREEGWTLALEGACHFVSLLEGEDDSSLLSKVKTESVLKELGAELWGDSVLLGDTAYQVVPGFVAVRDGAQGPMREEVGRAPALPVEGQGAPV